MLWIFRAPLLRGAANAWIVEQPVEPAGAIALVGGGLPTQIDEAAELHRRGIAPKIILVRGRLRPTDRAGISEPEVVGQQRKLIARGVPETAITIIGNEVSNAFEVMKALGEWAKQDKVERVIIPTEQFDTRRLSWCARKAAPGLDVRVRPVVDPQYTTGDWWRYERGLIAFENEVVLWSYYHLKY